MHWQRLDRDTSVKVIDSVKSDANAGMFSAGTSEVKRARALFYKDYFIYQVTNFASLPSFSFQYLSDGTFFHYLDGTEEPIHMVNDKGALQLDRHNILAYLDFYFANVSFEEGDITLIDNPNDMPILDSLGPDAYDAVFRDHTPPLVHENNGLDSFTIESDLYNEGQLVRAKIEVSAKGRVLIKEQKMIMHEMVAMRAPETMM